MLKKSPRRLRLQKNITDNTDINIENSFKKLYSDSMTSKIKRKKSFGILQTDILKKLYYG